MYPRGNGLDWWSTVFSGGTNPFLFCTQGSLTLVADEPHEQVCLGPCCMTVVQVDDDK